MASERLDKRLASTGRWSRKEVKELIRQGRVRVDGVPAARPEDRVEEGSAVLWTARRWTAPPSST